MKRIFTLFAVAAMTALTSMAATFNFTSEADVNQTIDGITVTIAKGSGNNAPAFYDPSLRLYASNTITVSGADIKSVSLTFSKQGQKDYATLSADCGSLVSGGVSTSNLDLVTDTWSGSTSSVTFTLGAGQRIINRIVVNGDGSEDEPSVPGTPGTPDTPDTPDTPGTLDPDYTYAEPTIITAPSTTVQGDAYTFISNNIQVSSTKGALSDSYFSAHAGFAITFTATKDIKGIAINGMVKKGFTATADHGKINYLTPDEDTDANPVVVITDIDSKSVTISCDKQLRCYSVSVYFNENPDATIGGGAGSGETITLNYDSADAVYEKEFSDEIGEVNYSIFLYNQDDDVTYFALDIYPEAVGMLEGTYSWDDWTLGDYSYFVYGWDDADFTWVDGGEVTITKSGETYTIKGTFICDNGNTYDVNFSGKMPIYVDSDYYEGEEPGGDGTGSVTGVEETENADAPKYDILGRKVGNAHRGIYIQNGKKRIAL